MSVKINKLSEQQSLFNQVMSEIRDAEIQTDSMRFRRNIERVGEIFAYEISKQMDYVEKAVTTPLGTSICQVLKEQPVLASILRAGLPLHQGLLNYFDRAENTFISAYRKHEGDEDHFEVEPVESVGRREDSNFVRPDAGHRFIDGAGLQGLVGKGKSDAYPCSRDYCQQAGHRIHTRQSAGKHHPVAR
jgi:uracil phosphoribosyltransferase